MQLALFYPFTHLLLLLFHQDGWEKRAIKVLLAPFLWSMLVLTNTETIMAIVYGGRKACKNAMSFSRLRTMASRNKLNIVTAKD